MELLRVVEVCTNVLVVALVVCCLSVNDNVLCLSVNRCGCTIFIWFYYLANKHHIMSRKRVSNTFKTPCIERLRPGSHWTTNCPIFTFGRSDLLSPVIRKWQFTLHSSAKLLSQSLPLWVEVVNCNKSQHTNCVACCGRTGKTFCDALTVCFYLCC